jgi:hypothetical protein
MEIRNRFLQQAQQTFRRNEALSKKIRHHNLLGGVAT